MTSASETTRGTVRVRDRYGDAPIADAVGTVTSSLPPTLLDDLEEVVLLRHVVVQGEVSRLEIGDRVRVVVIVGALASTHADPRRLTAAVLEQVFLQLGRYALLRQGDGLHPAEDPRVQAVAEELLARVRDT